MTASTDGKHAEIVSMEPVHVQKQACSLDSQRTQRAQRRGATAAYTVGRGAQAHGSSLFSVFGEAQVGWGTMRRHRLRVVSAVMEGKALRPCEPVLCALRDVGKVSQKSGGRWHASSTIELV